MFVVGLATPGAATREIEHKEYFCHLNDAINAARRRWRADQRPREVATWPDGLVKWDSANEPRPDFTALAREAFGPNPSQTTEVTETSTYEGGPDGY